MSSTSSSMSPTANVSAVIYVLPPSSMSPFNHHQTSILVGDTIALRPQCRSLGHYHVWIWRKLSLRQRRHKVAASKYSGLRGSREPDEVQAVIIGVMKLLVSQFIILQSDSIRFSGFMARDEILDHFYKRSGFKWESFRACNSFTMLCNCFFIENFNGLRLLKSL
ncbi:BnaC05g26600D [Brassica napus]|uniref:Uncharacterized protein n=2 Tax=Brassica TaxID=3705 RepID=A0A3P6FAM2_BRAOL|nr:unnamed protein product [Brassica napus]CDY07298.1 BnaC05g26600D [Brassica napus]VDD44554.1 unnamed protein product [Brassica oleracea]